MREEWKSDDGAMEDTVSPIKSDEQIDTLHTRLKRQLDALGSPATVPVYQPGPTGTLWQKLSTVTQKRTSTKSSQSDTTHTFVGSARKRCCDLIHGKTPHSSPAPWLHCAVCDT